MSDATGSPRRTLAVENRDLREQLAAAQDRLVELAIDAGHLHARIAALQDELRTVRAERDAMLAGASRRSAPPRATPRAHTPSADEGEPAPPTDR